MEFPSLERVPNFFDKAPYHFIKSNLKKECESCLPAPSPNSSTQIIELIHWSLNLIQNFSRTQHNIMKVVSLISGGKDSTYNTMCCIERGHEVVCLANLYPKVSTEEIDSFMYQVVGNEGIEVGALREEVRIVLDCVRPSLVGFRFRQLPKQWNCRCIEGRLVGFPVTRNWSTRRVKATK